MNPNRSEIDSFFDILKFNRRDLLELLPIGVMIFSENWVIKAINESFVYYFEEQFKDLMLEGLNLFSKSIISKTLPLPEIISLKEGNFFEKEITVYKEGEKKNYLIKGSPILKEGKFKGGIVIVEDFKNKGESKFPHSVPIDDAVSILNLFESSFFILNSKGTIKFISEKIPQSCEVFESSKGKGITELFSSDTKYYLEKAINDAVKDKKRTFLDLSYISDREKIDLKCVLLPLGIIEDIEDLIILMYRENKLQGTDLIGFLCNSDEMEELGSFADIGNDALFKVNLHGNITYWAKNAANLFGFKGEEVKSKFIDSVFSDVDREYFEDIRSNLLSKGEWEGYLRSERIEKGKICNVRIVSKISHNITDLFVYCNLIESQKRNLLAAKEEEELFFKDTVLKSSQMIMQINPSGTILFANDKFCEKMNYELDEIRGEQFFNLIDKDFKTRNKIYDLETLLAKKELDVLKLHKRNNELFEVSYEINLSRENEVIKYFTFYFDESSILNRLFLGTTHSLLYKFPEAIVIVQENKIIKVNSNFCKLFGVEFETEFYNKLIYEIVDPSSLENLNSLLLNNSIENDNVEISFLKNDKSVFKANVDKICCSRESSFSVLVVYPFTDEKVEGLNKIKEIEKSFKNFGPFYWSGFVVDDKITVDYLDSELIKRLGYSRKEKYDDSKFMTEIIHPNDAEEFFNSLQHFVNQKETATMDMNYRVINSRGEIVWIKNSIKLIVDITGKRILHGSLTDITEWFSEREELSRKIEDLDRLNRAKEKLISIISHDLKSPFTSIVGFADLILSDSSYGKEEILEFVGHIKDASLHTVELLNSLMDLTKLQTGRIEVEQKILNADNLVNKTVEILSGMAVKKGIELSSEIDKNLYINADDGLILQVFNNLVANSIKFTPKGGSIKIKAEKVSDEQKVEFRVKDTGVGIEAEDLDKLFTVEKKFTTLGTEGEKGTGLGLSLVREIIEKHNGEIKVESVVGEGSEFIFSLPISTPSILITDTSDAERILYSKLLESITESIQILQAGSVEEAVSKIKEKMPMLVILEHDLLSTTAIEFIDKLNKADLVYKPSFLVLTKQYSEDLHQSYRDRGIDKVLGKPFDLKEFKSILDKLTGKN